MTLTLAIAPNEKESILIYSHLLFDEGFYVYVPYVVRFQNNKIIGVTYTIGVILHFYGDTLRLFDHILYKLEMLILYY